MYKCIHYLVKLPIDSNQLLFSRESGKFEVVSYLLIDLSIIPVNKSSNLRLGWTNYSDLYEIVYTSLVHCYFLVKNCWFHKCRQLTSNNHIRLKDCGPRP